MSNIRQRPAPRRKDPREQLVQVNVKVPHWFREQMYDFCDETGKSFNSLVIGSILTKVTPRKPPGLTPWPPDKYRWNYKTPLSEIDDEAEG